MLRNGDKRDIKILVVASGNKWDKKSQLMLIFSLAAIERE